MVAFGPTVGVSVSCVLGPVQSFSPKMVDDGASGPVTDRCDGQQVVSDPVVQCLCFRQFRPSVGFGLCLVLVSPLSLLSRYRALCLVS